MEQTQMELEIKYLKEMVRLQSIRIDGVENANRILAESYKTLWAKHESAMNRHEAIADENTATINSVAKNAMDATEELKRYLQGNKPMEVLK